MLLGRNAVGDDAGPGLHRGLPVAHKEGSDRDRGVDVAGEVEVADHTAVGATLHRFEFVDDFHRPHLGGSRERAGRQRGPEHIDRRLAFGQLPRHLRCEVHDVAVTLEHKPFVDLFGTEGHDPTNIVAGQVEQHHVFGDFLGVLA